MYSTQYLTHLTNIIMYLGTTNMLLQLTHSCCVKFKGDLITDFIIKLHALYITY